jgi:sugar phosphate isomerase/epimerase
MKISIVTDELSADPETAFELGLEWGVRHFELRGVYDQRIPRLAPHTRRRLLRSVESFGVGITAVSPGLFKIPFPDAEPRQSNLGWMDAEFHRSWEAAQALLADHVDRLLPESLDFAAEIGAPFLIAFSFHRGGAPQGPAPAGVVEALARAAEEAAARGIGLLVETEEGHWANTGARSAELARRVGHPACAVNWDPANALIDGDTPFPDGYAAVRPFVRNVHFKDARRFADGSWTLTADGDVDWAGQIAALVADNYSGAIALEPHLSPGLASTRAALARLKKLIEAAKSASADA